MACSPPLEFRFERVTDRLPISRRWGSGTRLARPPLDLPGPLGLGIRIGPPLQTGQELTQHERLLLRGETESLVDYTLGTVRHA